MRRIVLVAFVVVVMVASALPALAKGSLTSDLSWANEVPPAVDTAATGEARVTLNHQQLEVCFKIVATGLSGDVTGAHIHYGAAGSNGPVVLDLGGSLKGCVEDVDIGLIAHIRSYPSLFYINVHTALNPGGEIRGQLSS